ncbi:NADP-dependent oxidoreductase [Rathayibacter sp. VKM Ac-2856]|uniref:NADP-dependent oxidoreductase n=1 Tax=unclassified Rathayibacter TaxID=2609250 RepID=UPI001566B951|nr:MULTISPECIES: NADP-dependent oxidoreductase [unclassified Rathayibacter]NQX04226.1 NADP-dependent oxidoreductase [Rathayibacter sp. VKM Ac-2858]NQX19395.1 NADP-dependent oxidoreductase [Rathayibacter sp. VKM Ac-2856]
MARIVQYARNGGPEVLEVVEVPEPEAPEGGVVVAIRAAGVNPIEWKMRSGVRPGPPFPRRPGSDGAGVITAVGSGVSGWSVGDRVIVSGASGTYADSVVVAPESLDRLPEGLGFEEAAALGVPISTAYQAVVSLGVAEGSVLLVHAGAGAVGQAAVQFAVQRGARVIATASPGNHDRLRELGAEPVAYGEGLEERLRAAAPGGVDRVLDAAGTDEALAASLALVSDPQHIGTVVVGARAAELGIRAWMGGSPVPLTEEEKALRREGIPRAAQLAADGRFSLELGPRFALEDVAGAHRLSEAGHPRGKILLVPTPPTE